MAGTGDLRSLSPKDYNTLPKLEAPAAYVCVIRDIDSDSYRIDATEEPGPFVAAILAEAPRNFGLELLSILETDDLRASESALYERHHARLSGAWLELDEVQLQGLRRSILQIDVRSSHYLRPPPRQALAIAIPQAETRYGRLMTSNSRAPGRTKWPDIQLSRHNSPARRRAGQPADAPSSPQAWIAGRVKYLLWNDPGCLLLVWIGLLVLGLLYVLFVSVRAYAW